MLRDYARCVGLDPDLVLQLPLPNPGSAPSAHQGTAPAATESERTRTAALSSLPALPAWTPSLPSVALGIVLGAALATFIADRGAGDERVAEPRAADTAASSTASAAFPGSASSPDGALDNGGLGNAATSGVGNGMSLEAIPVIPVNEPTRLVVTSEPAGARVTVDGIGWGVTPLTIQHLSPGDKIVRVTKDGFLAREQRVRVEGRAALRVTLRPRS
jgi:hypothetical protein